MASFITNLYIYNNIYLSSIILKRWSYWLIWIPLNGNSGDSLPVIPGLFIPLLIGVGPVGGVVLVGNGGVVLVGNKGLVLVGNVDILWNVGELLLPLWCIGQLTRLLGLHKLSVLRLGSIVIHGSFGGTLGAESGEHLIEFY